MSDMQQSVSSHYGVGKILDTILDALTEMGKDIEALMPSDLAPVDEFHIRGREATVELADRVGITSGLRVLDVGSGLGGSVRYLARERECHARGLDLTEEYVEVAKSLAKLVGLEGKVDFHQGSALELPFESNSFDVVWTEHAQMNIEDKDRFYSEISRVLKPRGRLAFHDIFQGSEGELHYPVPWAEDDSISFLATLDAVEQMLDRAGLEVRDLEDKSQISQDWFAEVVERMQESRSPPLLGLHLLMGAASETKFQNQIRNLREGKVVVIQAVAEKT